MRPHREQQRERGELTFQVLGVVLLGPRHLPALAHRGMMGVF